MTDAGEGDPDPGATGDPDPTGEGANAGPSLDLDLENPYLAAVEGGVAPGACRATLSDRSVDLARRRRRLVEEYAWGVPNDPAVATLLEHDPVLEVGAGNGYWTWLVEQAGGEVVATDPAVRTWEVVDDLELYTEVEALSATEAIDRYGPDHALFLCWPSDGAAWPAEALAAYGGDTVVYVGTGRGACNADHEFHRRLFEGFELAETVAIPTYDTCTDRLEVWTRTGETG